MRRLVVLLCALALAVTVIGCSPTAQLTAEEAAYIDVLEAQTKAIEDSLDRFDKSAERFVASSAGTDLAAMFAAEVEWETITADEADLWKRLHREARDLVPPARFAELNAKNLEMLGELETAGGQLDYALANDNMMTLGTGTN
ncbi:MAG: hypothetical protein M3R02_25980 [Chloroflexota bacterium]|nr:hypothetical protein [Chloroflexota bacterium]